MPRFNFSFRKIFFAFPVILASLASYIPDSQAQIWRNYEAKGNVYSLSFPEFFESEEVFMRQDSRYLLGANEITAMADNRPYAAVPKHYILKFSQTLGKELTAEQCQELIARELETYANYYSSLKGSVLEINDKAPQGDNPGGFITIGYEDPKLGPQMLRVHIVFTDRSMFQQIVTGMEKDIKAPSTENFFKSLVVENDLFRQNGSVKDEWKIYTPPLGIFTVYFPEATRPYLPKEPEISGKDKYERVSAQFYDPVLKQRVFVNVYGYELDRDIGAREVELFLQERFILRYPALVGSAVTTKINGLAFPTADTVFSIKPPDGYPYMDKVRVRVMYAQNYILAYEVIGTENLINGPFVDSLIRQVNFTPSEARARRTGQNAPRE